jgi:purine catabolism regulator
MPPTLRLLVDRPELALTTVGDPDLTRLVRWVHVSELSDPTAFLSGGELVLTAGFLADDTPEFWDQYVQRLVDRGVSGLGFGVGLRFEQVPTALAGAAQRLGLPLFVVPRPVSFIAIAKAVAAELAREEQQALSSAIDAQRELIQAAMQSTGPRAVIERLSKALNAWVLLLDEHGESRHCSPDTARRHLSRIQLDLDRLATADPFRASALTIAEDSVAVLPIVVHRRVGGFLVLGRPTTLATAEHSVLTTAVGLLSLALSGERSLRHRERQASLGVFQLAVGGHVELAARLADTLGVLLPDAPLRVAVIGASPEHMAELVRAAETHHGLCVGGALIAEYEPTLVAILLPVAQGDLFALEEVLHQVPQSRGAVSEGVRMPDLPDAWRRVRSVFFGASESPGKLLATKDVVTAGLLAQLDNPNAFGWASTLLEPLGRQAGRSRLSLIETLRVFLSHNGHIEASAATLGIHRHTLRYRLGRITELLGRELDDPTTRAELWIALRLREVS